MHRKTWGLVALILEFTFCDGQRVHTAYHNIAGFNYYEIVYGDTSNKRLPLVIAFHYSSSTPEELATYYDNVHTELRILIPKGNYTKRQGFSYYPVDHYSKDSVTQAKTVTDVVDSIRVFLESIYSLYPVNPVVTGISQGGDISLLLAIYYPQTIKAAVPILGFIHRKQYLILPPPKDKRVPIHLFHGRDDKIVPLDYVTKQVEYLQNNHQVNLAVYPNAGHEITSEMKNDYLKLIQRLLQ